MSEFREVTHQFWASPQIGTDDVIEARDRGFAMIINNRPEGEADDQTDGATIAAEALAAGMEYREIPVAPGNFTGEQVVAMRAALADAKGPVLAYCRSGTRSTLLWSLAQASRGIDPAEIARDAAQAGYDVAPIRPLMDMLAATPEA